MGGAQVRHTHSRRPGPRAGTHSHRRTCFARCPPFVPHREAAAYGPRLGGRGDGVLRLAHQSRIIEPFQQIHPDGQITSDYQKSCQAPSTKIILFSRIDNRAIYPVIPSHREGRCATYQRGAGMRWTRMALLTRTPDADGEIVWSRHPNGRCQVRARLRGRRWQKCRAHRGEHV